MNDLRAPEVVVTRDAPSDAPADARTRGQARLSLCEVLEADGYGNRAGGPDVTTVMTLRCRHLVMVFVFWGLLAACGAGPGSDPDTGVVGTITLGDTCPAALNVTCADRPFVATVDVRDESGRHVRTVRSDEDGHFRVELDPGNYTLVPAASNSGAPPTAPPQTVKVAAGRHAAVRIRYDSGVR